jgi:hypothetical protein
MYTEDVVDKEFLFSGSLTFRDDEWTIEHTLPSGGSERLVEVVLQADGQPVMSTTGKRRRLERWRSSERKTLRASQGERTVIFNPNRRRQRRFNSILHNSPP